MPANVSPPAFETVKTSGGASPAFSPFLALQHVIRLVKSPKGVALNPGRPGRVGQVEQERIVRSASVDEFRRRIGQRDGDLHAVAVKRFNKRDSTVGRLRAHHTIAILEIRHPGQCGCRSCAQNSGGCSDNGCTVEKLLFHG